MHIIDVIYEKSRTVSERNAKFLLTESSELEDLFTLNCLKREFDLLAAECRIIFNADGTSKEAPTTEDLDSFKSCKALHRSICYFQTPSHRKDFDEVFITGYYAGEGYVEQQKTVQDYLSNFPISSTLDLGNH